MKGTWRPPASLDVEPREHPARTRTGAQRAPGTQESAEPRVPSAGSQTGQGEGALEHAGEMCYGHRENQQRGSKANVGAGGRGGNLSRAHCSAGGGQYLHSRKSVNKQKL